MDDTRYTGIIADIYQLLLWTCLTSV